MKQYPKLRKTLKLRFCLYNVFVTYKTRRLTTTPNLWTRGGTSLYFSCRAALAEESSFSRAPRQASKARVCSSHSVFFCATIMSICFISSCSSASQEFRNPPLQGKELEVTKRHPRRRPSGPDQQSRQKKAICTKGLTPHTQRVELYAN